MSHRGCPDWVISCVPSDLITSGQLSAECGLSDWISRCSRVFTRVLRAVHLSSHHLGRMIWPSQQPHSPARGDLNGNTNTHTHTHTHTYTYKTSRPLARYLFCKQSFGIPHLKQIQINGDLQVGILNADFKKTGGYTPCACVYPALHHCTKTDEERVNKQDHYQNTGGLPTNLLVSYRCL